jgi:hypothetical protein
MTKRISFRAEGDDENPNYQGYDYVFGWTEGAEQDSDDLRESLEIANNTVQNLAEMARDSDDPDVAGVSNEAIEVIKSSKFSQN